VLVNLPVDQLQQLSELELEALARQTRQRLHEARERLGAELPVYLVLSKADKVIGFDEFFDQLSREESDQVLGATFRREQNGTDAQVVREAFEALLQRLSSQVLLRMHQERDTQRRGRILDFPHQLGQLGERLSLFIELAFAGNRYQRASHLRGFYLTSAPRLQDSLDPLTSGIGRQLGLASGALPAFRQGRARFIHHLLSRVIFAEADLASLDQKEIRRIDWGQRAVYAIALACLGLFGILWAQGFSANHERLEQLRELAERIGQENRVLGPTDDARRTLAALDASYAATEVFPAPRDAAWSERSGLYQGEAVEPAVVQAYRAQLERLLLPRVTRQLEGQIRANLDDREELLNSLRAYLMLRIEARRDPAFLKQWLAADWSLRYAGDALAQNGLNSHFARLLEQPFAAPTLDDDLIAKARQTLRSESLAQVVYRMLREQARALPDYRLDQHLGPQGALLTGADYRIPGFYTQQGYRQYYLTQGGDLVREILRDNWVLGEGESLSSQDLARLMVEMEQLYFRDYGNLWGEALAQLAVMPLPQGSQGAAQLAGLAGANSPLLQLLVEVREHTRLPGIADATSEAPAEGAKADGALGKVAAVAEKARDALASNLPDTARLTMERRFEALHLLLDDNGGAAADLVPVMRALNELQLQLATLARSSQPEQAAFDLARNRMGGQSDALANLRSSASRLPQPIGGWLAMMAGESWHLILSGAHQYLNQRYQSELYGFYLKALDKRYPFNPRSHSDVALSDFREFFKTQGLAERFFDTYLKPFVIGTPGEYRVRSVDGGSLPIARGFLDQMANAQAIRLSFFADNPNEPQVRFRLEPYSIDPALSRAEFRFGDRLMEYRHGPIVPMSFKWPTEAEEGRSSLVLEELSGRRIGVERNTGPWSLFRLFDQMQAEYHSGRDVLMLKVEVDGLRAHYLVQSQRSPNPFDLGMLRAFRLPVSL